MTLPTDIILPEPQDFTENPAVFVDDLVNSLQEMYENITNSFNGTFRNNTDIDGTQWVPSLNGSVAGTFSYISSTGQLGWVFRQGIMVDVWGHIAWSATTASGTLSINLPYEVINADSSLLFTGECNTSGITFSTGTAASVTAIPGTFTANIYTYGSGIALTQMTVPSSGALNFHLRYIGVSLE